MARIYTYHEIKEISLIYSHFVSFTSVRKLKVTSVRADINAMPKIHISAIVLISTTVSDIVNFASSVRYV